MNNKYIVYMASLYGNPVYVGHGLVGRQKHIISGVSHCYEANKAHFNGSKVLVEVLKAFDNKQEASDYESKLIKEYRPSWNKVIGAEQFLKMGSDRKTYLKGLYKELKITNKRQQDFIKMVLTKIDGTKTCKLTMTDLQLSMDQVSTQYLSEIAKGLLVNLNKVLTCERVKMGTYKVTWIYPLDTKLYGCGGVVLDKGSL